MTWNVKVAPDNEPGEKLIITGKVYQSDGKTPAEGIIIYLYHTNEKGIYDHTGITSGWGRRHGKLRSWIKTNEKGEYRFETIRPGSYPKGRNPAHIHVILKEENRPPYWIDDYHFEGDPFISEEESEKLRSKQNSGFIKLTKNEKGIWTGTRDIVLLP